MKYVESILQKAGMEQANTVCTPLMRCVVCRDVQCTNNKILNFTLSAGCLLCNATIHTEVWLQVQRGFRNLVY